MRKMLIVGLMLSFVLPLGAKVVGVVIKFRGAVFFQKKSNSGLRRVYSQLPVRDNYRLIVRDRSSVAVLLFNGKLLTMERAGKYRVNAKNMLVSYNDLLRHHRSISSSGLSSAVGATRSKAVIKIVPLRIISPAGAFLERLPTLVVKKMYKSIKIIQVRIKEASKIVLRSNFENFSRDVRSLALRAGRKYYCEVQYLYNGKKWWTRTLFVRLQLIKRASLEEQLSHVNARPLQRAVKHYLRGVIYSRYGLFSIARKLQYKAARLDKRFR